MAKKKAAKSRNLAQGEPSSSAGKQSYADGSRRYDQIPSTHKSAPQEASRRGKHSPHKSTTTEEQLREAKEYAEAIVETLHEPLLVLHPDLTVKSCNSAFYEHFQVRPEETRGRMIYDLGNGQWDIPDLKRLLEDVLPDSKVFNDYEVHHDFDDLGPRVMLLNARRLDHVQMILLGIRDITEKKQAEEDLRRSEERYRTLFESIDAGFCIVEVIFDEEDRPIDYRFLEVNPAFERQTGLKDAAGRRMRELRPNHEEHWFETYGRIARTGDPARFENQAAQLQRWYDVYAWRHGKPQDRQVAILFNDITPRKDTEQKLRDSEERYRLLVESAQEYAMLMLDVDGRITAWNSGAERIFRYREREAIGQSASIIFTEEDRAAGVPQAELETAAYRGQASDDRWQLRKDGSRFWASGVTEALRDEGGNLRGFSKVLRDNTRYKQHEEALRKLNESLEQRVAERTEELERQNARLRSLAHELTQTEHRERVNIGQTLHDGLQQILVAAKMHATARNKKGSLDHVVKLLEDSLTASRTLSYELNPPRLRESSLASATEWLAEWFAENHGHTVEVVATPDFPELSEDAKVLLYAVVRELLLNSVKHSGVQAAEVRLLSGSGGEAIIEVEDDGQGFDPIHVRQDHDGPQGFGLFSISERLAALGGRLEIEASPGEGACFTITLPT